MSSFGAPIIMFDALDGSKYKTGMDGWSQQSLRSTGDVVFVKLINLGDKTRLVAIDREQAINKGVDQLFTKNEKARAEAAKKPKPTVDDYKAMQRDAEKIAAVREAAMGGKAAPGTVKSTYPWAKKNQSSVNVGDRITKPVVVTKPKATKPAVDTSVAGMISNEAKRLNKKG